MHRAFNILLLVLISVSLTSCYRTITMTILNDSKENITIEYRKPVSANEQLYLSPKTYTYNPSFSNFKKYDGKVKEEHTNFSSTNDSNFKIILEPGKILVIGKYKSNQNREDFLPKYNLKLDIGPATTDGFEFWENYHNDVLWIRRIRVYKSQTGKYERTG